MLSRQSKVSFFSHIEYVDSYTCPLKKNEKDWMSVSFKWPGKALSEMKIAKLLTDLVF